MSTAAPDPNLLFGSIAVQINFLSRDALAAALPDWKAI